jgi:hypothetical protein
MQILASYDLTRTAWSAAQLAGCDPKTVQRYVDLSDAGLDPFRRTRRARLIDPYLEKVEELVEESRAKIRADVVHDRFRASASCGGLKRFGKGRASPNRERQTWGAPPPFVAPSPSFTARRRALGWPAPNQIYAPSAELDRCPAVPIAAPGSLVGTTTHLHEVGK